MHYFGALTVWLSELIPYKVEIETAINKLIIYQK